MSICVFSFPPFRAHRHNCVVSLQTWSVWGGWPHETSCIVCVCVHAHKCANMCVISTASVLVACSIFFSFASAAGIISSACRPWRGNMHMYWRQAINEAASAPSQCCCHCFKSPIIGQCSGENMHLARGLVIWPLVLLFCPKHVLQNEWFSHSTHEGTCDAVDISCYCLPWPKLLRSGKDAGLWTISSAYSSMWINLWLPSHTPSAFPVIFLPRSFPAYLLPLPVGWNWKCIDEHIKITCG